MRKEQEQVLQFMIAAKQKCPNRPVVPEESIGRLRLSLILEETVELANALGFCCQFDHTDFSSMPEWKDKVQVADGIADLLYVVIGTAVACGIDIEPIFQEVHRSNMTKFIDGTFREDGKYVKGPNHSKPNIADILNAQ